MGRFHRELHTLFCVAIVFFLLFGFGLTAGSDVLYNALIMPFAGVIAYLAFRWRAVYMLPLLFFLVGYFASAALSSEGLRYVVAIAAFLLGILPAIAYDRKEKRSGGMVFNIVRLF